MGKVVVIANQKGGVGKTTTAINLTASLALAGKDILVIDTDPQGNLTSGLGISHDDIHKSLYDVYTSSCSIKQAIMKSLLPNLHVVPSTIDLLGIELELVDREHRESVLLHALKEIRQDYPFIFIDCPPSLGLLTLNAMVAADSVLVPVQCEYYSLEGLSMLSKTISLVQENYNPELQIEGILLTMFDSRNSLSHQVANEVRKHFDHKVYKTIIPRNVALAEAPSFCKPVMLYDAKSKGAQSYLALAKEILNEAGIR